LEPAIPPFGSFDGMPTQAGRPLRAISDGMAS
jgi:hypothetical protein